MKNTTVSVRYCKDYELENVKESVFSCIDDLGGIDLYVKKDDVVIVKANLCGKYEPNLAVTTHPTVVQAVCQKVLEVGAKCIVVDCGDNSTNKNNITKIYQVTGIFDIAIENNITLNKDLSFERIEIDGKQTKSLELFSVLNEATAIINVSKLKTSVFTGISGSVENLFGFIPAKIGIQVKNLYKNLSKFCNYLIDLEEYLDKKIVLNIVDAVVGMEGMGPIKGTQRILNRIIASTSPYLADLTSLFVIGYPSNRMPLIYEAIKRNKFPFDSEFLEDKVKEEIAEHVAEIKEDGEKNEEKMSLTTRINNELISQISLLGDLVTTSVSDFNFSEVANDTNVSPTKKAFQNIYFKHYERRPVVDLSKCKGCTLCSKSCPVKAITMLKDKNNDLSANIDYSNCIYCFKCVEACPYKIIKTVEPMGYKKIRKN